MTQIRPVFDLLARLHESESTLMRKYGVRLRVDKVTFDARNALCSATQVQRRFLRSDHTQEAIVEYCQFALMPLYRVGISPLISACPQISDDRFEKIEPTDPFQLRSALIHARSEGLLLPEFVVPQFSYAHQTA